MNLHQMVASAIGTINPFIPAELWQSTGYTTNADGTQVPSYNKTCMMVQVQSLSTDELRQIEGLNLQGSKNAVYLNGNWNGIIRVGRQGGDLIVFNRQTWLVVINLESWADWCKLAVVLQNGP